MADPAARVDPSTGGLVLQERDVRLPGYVPFEVRRVHRSRVDRTGPLGPGWRSSLEEAIRPDGEGLLWWTRDGREVQLPRPDPDEEMAHPGEGVSVSVHPVRERGGRKAARITLRTGRLQRHFRRVGADWVFRPVRVEDPCGNSLEFEYADGRLTGIRDSFSRRIEVRYDGPGDRASELRLHGPEETRVLVRYAYDDQGRLHRADSADGPASSYRYRDGLVVSRSDPAHGPWHHAYDRDRRCIRSWSASGHLERYRYDGERLRTLVVTAGGGTAVHQLDEDGRILATIGSDRDDCRYGYDDEGRLEYVESEADPPWYLGYDEAGRPTAAIREDGQGVRIGYDEEGRIVSRTDLEENRWRAEYDDRSNLVAHESPEGQRTRFEYDERGGTVALRLPAGPLVQREYSEYSTRLAVRGETLLSVRFDLMGRPTEERRPSRGPSGASEVLDRIEPPGRWRSRLYDRGTRARFSDPRALLPPAVAPGVPFLSAPPPAAVVPEGLTLDLPAGVGSSAVREEEG